MKKKLLVILLCAFQQTYSMATLKQLISSPEVQKVVKEVAVAGVVYISSKIGWKEFKKGNLFPGQKKKEKSSQKVRRKLHKEVLKLQKEVMLNRKLLMYLLNVCDEAYREEFETLLSEEEKVVITQLF